MEFVLTLIADPASADLNREHIAAAQAVLDEVGAAPDEPDWLAPGVACDLAFPGPLSASGEAALRSALKGAPIDLGIRRRVGRRKSLLLADMDSTIVTSETLAELAEFVGLKAEIAAITARAMAGELDYAASLRERVAMLAGLSAEFLDSARERLELSPGARTLVQTMKAHGSYTALISGGFTQFTAWARDACGFDEEHANRFLVADGRLTGQVQEPILDRNVKLNTLIRLAENRGLPLSDTCTVGDGANDTDMLQAAGLGVAYRAKPAARDATRFRVDHGDLTALLYLQGYRRDQFET